MALDLFHQSHYTWLFFCDESSIGCFVRVNTTPSRNRNKHSLISIVIFNIYFILIFFLFSPDGFIKPLCTGCDYNQNQKKNSKENSPKKERKLKLEVIFISYERNNKSKKIFVAISIGSLKLKISIRKIKRLVAAESND